MFAYFCYYLHYVSNIFTHDRTRDEIFALFNNHIKAVNAIYEVTDFGGVRGINFNVQRTTVSASF